MGECGVRGNRSTKEGARRRGGDAGALEMVERRDALRPGGPRPVAGNGTLAEAMDGFGVARVHC
jgi:hypothetical protein